MTLTLIHDRGRTLVIKQPKERYIDPTEHTPRETQRARPRGTWKAWREMKMPKEHNGYKPGFVYDLGADQCRFIPGEDHIMCGAKTDGKSSYCEAHHAVVVRKRNDEQA